MKAKTFFIAAILYPLFVHSVFAENLKQIDFYGVASKDTEKNMLSMTEDLFFAQLKELNYTIEDKRYENFSTDYFSNTCDFSASNKHGTAAVFAVITKLDSGKWEMKINFLEYNNSAPRTMAQVYDSYYKILMESKNSLTSTLTELMSTSSVKTNVLSDSPEEITLEDLAGSWNGGKYINKIIIMRGGRGFVIFKNGASMNISVKIEKNEGIQNINIVQTSGNNASYFPEIERKKALEAAMSANPIFWNLKPVNKNTLTGTENTLTEDSAGNIKESSVSVTWKKIIQ